MTRPEAPPPVSRAATWGLARAFSAALATATAAALGGCERGLCPAAAFEVDILVRLSEEWPATGDRLVTVGCPESEECGFLNGPVTDDAVPFTTISTVLRPPEIDVLVVEVATGRELAHHVLPVEYVPVGPQNRCGSGRALAGVTVPYDPPEAGGTPAPGTTTAGR